MEAVNNPLLELSDSEKSKFLEIVQKLIFMDSANDTAWNPQLSIHSFIHDKSTKTIHKSPLKQKTLDNWIIKTKPPILLNNVSETIETRESASMNGDPDSTRINGGPREESLFMDCDAVIDKPTCSSKEVETVLKRTDILASEMESIKSSVDTKQIDVSSCILPDSTIESKISTDPSSMCVIENYEPSQASLFPTEISSTHGSCSYNLRRVHGRLSCFTKDPEVPSTLSSKQCFSNGSLEGPLKEKLKKFVKTSKLRKGNLKTSTASNLEAEKTSSRDSDHELKANSLSHCNNAQTDEVKIVINSPSKIVPKTRPMTRSMLRENLTDVIHQFYTCNINISSLVSSPTGYDNGNNKPSKEALVNGVVVPTSKNSTKLSVHNENVEKSTLSEPECTEKLINLLLENRVTPNAQNLTSKTVPQSAFKNKKSKVCKNKRRDWCIRKKKRLGRSKSRQCCRVLQKQASKALKNNLSKQEESLNSENVQTIQVHKFPLSSDSSMSENKKKNNPQSISVLNYSTSLGFNNRDADTDKLSAYYMGTIEADYNYEEYCKLSEWCNTIGVNLDNLFKNPEIVNSIKAGNPEESFVIAGHKLPSGNIVPGVYKSRKKIGENNTGLIAPLRFISNQNNALVSPLV